MEILAAMIMGKHRIVICIILSSILFNATGNEFQTNLFRFKFMQGALKAQILERQLLEERYLDAERANAKSMDPVNHAYEQLEFQLPNHNDDVVSSSNIEKRPIKKVDTIVAELDPTKPKAKNLTTHTTDQINKRGQPHFVGKSFNDQKDYTCHVPKHCRDGAFVAKPCSVIVPRAEWGARDTLSASYMNKSVSTIFIHHTALGRCFTSQKCVDETRAIQDLHMNKNGWDDIGYSFVVGDDGFAYEGRGWKRVGAHTSGWNSKSVSIAVMGNFNYDLPSHAALKAIDSLISCGILTSNVLANYTLHGHRAASKTFDSPGHHLHELIQTWPHHATLTAKE